MTDRDDIIRMAREADINLSTIEYYQRELEHFAARVAAAEREACAGVVKDYLTAARFDHRHIELGDIRLTIGDQENLEAAIRARGEQK